MKQLSLENMIKGWFVGQFTPSAYSSKDVEVAVKRYNKGDKECVHHHRIATEITVIVSGTVRMNQVEYGKNDIIVIDPYEATDFFALEDVVTVVVKVPGALDDKHEGEYFD